MPSDQVSGLVGLVQDLARLARAVSPEVFIEKIGGFVLVGPAATVARGATDPRDQDGWTFETKLTGTSPAAMLTDAFESHEVYVIKKARTTFFRNVIMVGRAASNDVILEGASISKLHARLKPHGDGRFVITDAGSKYGTFVGADRLADDEEREIGHGDHVRFGDRPFKLFEAERFHKVLVRMVLP